MSFQARGRLPRAQSFVSQQLTIPDSADMGDQ
jgi:hypothetical protein